MTEAHQGDAETADPQEQDGVGCPDDWERLWTPHRMAYIKGEGKPSGPEPDDGCPFCRIPGVPDADGLVVARGASAYVVLNLYPYAPGHLMVCPYRHVADYPDLDDAETAEVAALTKRAMTVLRAVSGAHGFNIGMNQGGVAGAGIAAHLHQHVVPRWGGDTNFMPVVGRTKVLPQLLGDTRSLLADAWDTTD
ncbi:MAG: HIT domain-containing protein [Streptosporangiales bacterium]|nr:HIT domain-containing protein [Streptosporangiales bacterium]